MKSLVKIQNHYLLNRLALGAFFAAATYSVLLWSPNVLGKHINTTTIIFLLLLPWFLLCRATNLEIVKSKEHRPEIILLITIIILGIFNVFLSDNPDKSYHAMRMFLLCGVMALWTSMFLLTDPARVKIFDYFCWLCIPIVTITEISVYLSKGFNNTDLINIFALNPIPLGTLLILLSPGLARLLASPKKWPLISGGVLGFLGFSLILVTKKRGTFLALIVMGLAWLFWKRNKLSMALATLLILIALIIPFKGWSTYKSLNPYNLSHFNILHRLELYPFGWHVFLKHPVFGIGLRPYTHEKYLSDYPGRQNLRLFPETVKQLQTFDNMLLTSFVELGTLMTLAYLALITLIIVKYCRKLRPLAQSPPLDLYRLAALIGCAVHSMTYDSLLFPSINWLFHVQLGILAAYSATSGSASKANHYYGAPQ